MSEHDTLDKIRDKMRNEAGEVIERLKKERDVLTLQSHLFKAELKDEWEEIEEKWQGLESRFDQIFDDASESTHEMGSALKKAGDELSESYRRLRKEHQPEKFRDIP